MGMNLRIDMLMATALQGEEGENFLLTITVDGRNAGSHESLKSEVVSGGVIVWLLKNNGDASGNKNEISVEIEEDSLLAFELRRPSSVQALSSTEDPIARFSATVDDLFSQRKTDSGLEDSQLSQSDSQVGGPVGGRVLYLSWEIEQLRNNRSDGGNRAARCYPTVDVHHSDTVLPRKLPSEVYSQLLYELGRGTPLWTPVCPRRDAPRSYKRNGVEIGDVGIITPHDGAFQYYFNIFHRPGHEENPHDLPDNLLWTGPVPDILEYAEVREAFESHGRGTARCTGINSLTLEHTVCASNWAILAVPNGSKSKSVMNQQIMEDYLKTREEDLYRYFIDQRGIRVKNGDVRLVVGWTKANAWGMAAFSDPNSSPHPCTLKMEANPEHPRIPEYRWDCSEGFVTTKSGPGLYEIQKVRESEDDTDVQQMVNQCLFVNTLRVTIRGNVWIKRLQELGVNLDATTHNTVVREFGRPTSARRQRSTFSGSVGSRYSGQWSDTRDLNPSLAIQRLLLAMKPNAESSISGDMNWMSIAKERDAFLPHSKPNIPYILSRVLELNEICEEGGSVTLKPRHFNIPSIHVYINSVDSGLAARIQARTSYSKVTFVEKLDQADVWILEINGQCHGRIIHSLSFRDAREPLLQRAFAHILPFFRLLLQLDGILEVYGRPQSLVELECLQNSPELKRPADTWYSLSEDGCFMDGCFICNDMMQGDTVNQIDFEGLVPHEQTTLPLGRDAVNILSRHLASLLTMGSLKKNTPDVNPNLEDTVIQAGSKEFMEIL